jgi:ABC-2 type transport system permease protein
MSQLSTSPTALGEIGTSQPDAQATQAAEPFTPSLSRSVSAWTVMVATVIKQLQITRRYLPDFVGLLVDLGIRLGFFMLMATVLTVESEQMQGQSLSGQNLSIYLIGAMVLFMFQAATLWGPIDAVTTDLYNGTLEFLYSNPGSRYAYYVGSVVTRVIVRLPIFLPFYLVLVIYSQASIRSMLLILLVCLTTLVTLTAMGIMIGLLAILWQRVTSIVGVLERLFEFLSGAYFPLSTFPKVAQYLGYLLPYTWSYDLIRYYSIEGAWRTILPVWQEWAILGLFAIVFIVASRYLLQKVEQLAKRKGLHLL